MQTSSLMSAMLLGVVLSSQSPPPARPFQPAQLGGGGVPSVPVTAVGGGEVVVELSVNAAGRVTAVTPLRSTPPFTDGVVRAVGGWSFVPAEADVAAATPGARPVRSRVETKVGVAAVFLPPALLTPTHGEAARDVAQASAESAVPVAMTSPLYPPRAFGGGVVLLEVRVDPDGTAGDVKVIRSARPFDDAAVNAVRQWRFRAARVGGKPVSTLAYVIAGFPVPVTSR